MALNIVYYGLINREQAIAFLKCPLRFPKSYWEYDNSQQGWWTISHKLRPPYILVRPWDFQSHYEEFVFQILILGPDVWHPLLDDIELDQPRVHVGCNCYKNKANDKCLWFQSFKSSMPTPINDYLESDIGRRRGDLGLGCKKIFIFKIFFRFK